SGAIVAPHGEVGRKKSGASGRRVPQESPRRARAHGAQRGRYEGGRAPRGAALSRRAVAGSEGAAGRHHRGAIAGDFRGRELRSDEDAGARGGDHLRRSDRFRRRAAPRGSAARERQPQGARRRRGDSRRGAAPLGGPRSESAGGPRRLLAEAPGVPARGEGEPGHPGLDASPPVHQGARPEAAGVPAAPRERGGDPRRERTPRGRAPRPAGGASGGGGTPPTPHRDLRGPWRARGARVAPTLRRGTAADRGASALRSPSCVIGGASPWAEWLGPGGGVLGAGAVRQARPFSARGSGEPSRDRNKAWPSPLAGDRRRPPQSAAQTRDRRASWPIEIPAKLRAHSTRSLGGGQGRLGSGGRGLVR